MRLRIRAGTPEVMASITTGVGPDGPARVRVGIIAAVSTGLATGAATEWEPARDRPEYEHMR